jgi:hypothetical protein
MRVGTALRERLLADVRVARSGSSVLTDRAAKWRRIELPVSGASASIWVRSADELVALAREYGLIAAAVGDVSVAVAGVPGLGACGDGDGNAYRLVVAADLLSSTDARGRRAGRDLLERVVQERRWSARPGEPVGISGPR